MIIHTKMTFDENTQIAVLGLGNFGKSMARVLIENGCHVLCCDINPAVVHEVAQFATHVIQADVTDESVIESIDLSKFDVVIIALSQDFEASVMTTMMAKEKGVPYIMVKANGYRQKTALEKIGADKVVFPEEEYGAKLAYGFLYNDPVERIHGSDDYEIIEMSPRENWISRNLNDLDLRKNESINILAIIRNDEVMALLPPDTIIQKNDRLIVLQSA